MNNRMKKLLLSAVLIVILPLNALPASASEITLVHPDHLGSPVAYTDIDGNVIGREYYTPYGESLNPPTTDDTVSYTGHVRDGDTGLLYMQARYYDPEIGRFLSVDPVTFSPDQPQQFNRYWYANGNPYKYTDPDGREPGDFAAGFAMGLVFSEEELEKIKAAEAACKACGPDIADGIDAGQAAGTLIAEGVSGKTLVAAMSKIDGKRKGRTSDSSKNEKHGDGGRALSKAEKQIADLKEQLDGASKKERKRIEKKIQNIRENAERKKRGEEHSRGPKR